jgi:hypothetical protein
MNEAMNKYNFRSSRKLRYLKVALALIQKKVKLNLNSLRTFTFSLVYISLVIINYEANSLSISYDSKVRVVKMEEYFLCF